LRALDPPVGAGPANVWQCVQLASHRFHDTPGEKILVLASTLPSPGNSATWYQLGPEVKVLWIFTGCSDIPTCRTGEDAWGRALSSAGVRDHRFFDSGESQTLSAIFGSPHTA
jgi:hypothetical protein